MLFFILTLGAAVCFAFGNVLAKSGVAKSGEKADIHHPIRFIVSFLTSKRWWTGFCLSALGNVGNYTAMALYNLSLVKPISALNPVLTAIFGRIFLKEPINRRVVAAIVCVLCGLLFASSDVGEAPGVQNIPALCIFVGILLAFAFASHFIFRSPEVGDSITMGTCYGLSDVLYKSLAIDATAKGIQLSADELLYWIADVRVWAFAATYITAFVFTQVAFSRGRALFVIQRGNRSRRSDSCRRTRFCRTVPARKNHEHRSRDSRIEPVHCEPASNDPENFEEEEVPCKQMMFGTKLPVIVLPKNMNSPHTS